jgi:7-carboxy-7-deazaguanine synthase
MATASLVVNEIFLSVQGESTFAGLPCVFIRLTACHLRCSYCDTAYAFTEGRRWKLPEIMQRVRELAAPWQGRNCSLPLPLVEVTGGEPLLQPNSLPLMTSLCDAGWVTLLETSGSLDISAVDPRVRRIVDIKCPASGEAARNRWDNLACLKATDELKFVIASRQDYEWAREQVVQRRLAELCPILFSWAAPLTEAQRDASLKAVPAGHEPISRQELAERILADGLPVRFQTQLHKIIWAPDQRGV